jgi:hypothetical protein
MFPLSHNLAILMKYEKVNVDWPDDDIKLTHMLLEVE